jgi:hypothetical protein
MGKEYTSEELANKTFVVSMIGVGLFIVAVFVFILL